jgi:hypothetical protein
MLAMVSRNEVGTPNFSVAVAVSAATCPHLLSRLLCARRRLF